jgi:hypothetical protein
LETSNFMLQSPAAVRVGNPLSPRFHHAADGLNCATQQRWPEAGLAFIFWEKLRCNVIYLQYLPLPNFTKTSVHVFKEA